MFKDYLLTHTYKKKCTYYTYILTIPTSIPSKCRRQTSTTRARSYLSRVPTVLGYNLLLNHPATTDRPFTTNYSNTPKKAQTHKSLNPNNLTVYSITGSTNISHYPSITPLIPPTPLHHHHHHHHRHDHPNTHSY